jgi:hypothetical protein
VGVGAGAAAPVMPLMAEWRSGLVGESVRSRSAQFSVVAWLGVGISGRGVAAAVGKCGFRGGSGCRCLGDVGVVGAGKVVVGGAGGGGEAGDAVSRGRVGRRGRRGYVRRSRRRGGRRGD